MVNSPITALLFDSSNFPTFGKLTLNVARLAQKTFPRSNAVRKLYHSVRNWYEGGWPLFVGGNTSYLPSLVQDARWDQNYVTRREMLRRMRYWSQNSPLVEAILSVGERYTVGSSGLHVHFYPDDFDGSEDKWYEAADEVVREWFANCGWNNETMESLLKIGYRDQKVDGEVFYLKTRKALPLTIGNRTLRVQKPAIQIIEAHRVETPWNKFDQSNQTLIDGVQYEKVTVDGRDLLQPIGFWVRTGSTSFEQNDSWNLVTNDQVWHLRNLHRADQPRSVSDFYAVEVTINKLEDTLDIEDKAHSSQSVRALAIETASGQAAPPTDRKIEYLQKRFGVNNQPLPVDDMEKRREVYRKETGAYVYGLKLGEKVHFDSPTRPSDQTLNLIELRINFICCGVKHPRCLVIQKISGNSAKSQGTEVRAELDTGNSFFTGDSEKWKRFVIESTTWFMEWAIKNDPRVADPPANWRNCLHVQSPEACNVDVGNNASAQTMGLAAGTENYHTILGPRGINPVSHFRKLAYEQKMIDKLGIKLTLPALMPGQIPLDGQSPKEKTEANA